MTYTYHCPIHGEFEYEHPISASLDVCPFCKEQGETTQVSRLIVNANGFILNGSCWGKDNYGK